jgi:hypothetical protein
VKNLEVDGRNKSLERKKKLENRITKCNASYC